MYRPIYLPKYEIYDIFYSNGHVVIIRPAESLLDIYVNHKKCNLYICPHKHTYIYKLKTPYTSQITITIQNETILSDIHLYPSFTNEIILSTLVKNEDNYIKQWIDFHKHIGVTRFIIYDNSLSNTLKHLLHEYISNQEVILIQWSFPYHLPTSGISGQTTQQNHSIYAFPHAKYIGLFDIDEYINMQSHTNLHKFFEDIIEYYHINTDQIGSFTLRNKFFYNPENEPTENTDFLHIYHSDLITKTGHEKNFVIPKNVKTFSVHMITDGKPMFVIDEQYIFFNHYTFLNKKNRGKNVTNHMDSSILKHLKYS